MHLLSRDEVVDAFMLGRLIERACGPAVQQRVGPVQGLDDAEAAERGQGLGPDDQRGRVLFVGRRAGHDGRYDGIAGTRVRDGGPFLVQKGIV